MAPALTIHDLGVLDKIKDPESGPAPPIMIDSSLPRDPYITDPNIYKAIVIRELKIVAELHEAEIQISDLKSSSSQQPLSIYLRAVTSLGELIEEYPDYASARNNRAQALRRIYGDDILVHSSATKSEKAPALDQQPSDDTLIVASAIILGDLTTAINLLTPLTPFAPISPQTAKTLAHAYTQRGAVYHLTAKLLSPSDAELRIDPSRKELGWKKVDFEENASRDFGMGGRYGSEIGKALAVSVNPTAKLCGKMVKEAMRKEYASSGE